MNHTPFRFTNSTEGYNAIFREPLHQLPMIFERVENTIELELKLEAVNALLDWSKANNKDLKHDERRKSHISVDGIPHTIELAAEPSNADVLALTIRCLVKSQTKMRRKAFNYPLCKSAPFQVLRIRLEQSLVESVESVSSRIGNAINSSYQKLEDAVDKRIEQENGAFVDELYAIVRGDIPESTANLVWLYLITNQSGVFVMDRLARGSLLDQARDYGSSGGISPAWVLSRIGGILAPPENTIDVQEVVPSRRTTVYDPISNPASEDLSIALPQHILAGGSAEIVQPLIGLEEGDLQTSTVWLTAVYPGIARDQIEPHLKGAGRKLVKFARLQGEKLRAMPESASPKHRAVKTWWGRLTGGLISEKLD